MKRAIEKVIRICGPDIFLNTNQFLFAIEDLMPDNISEIQFLKEIYTKSMAQLLYDGYIQNKKMNESVIGKLIENICVNEKTHYTDVYKRLYRDIYGTTPSSTLNFGKIQSTNNMISTTTFKKVIDTISSKKISETFFLGRYVQSSNGAEKPIEWIVVKKDSKSIIAISRYALLAKPYNNEWVRTSWQESSIRQYLNTVFIKEAFSNLEMNIIGDCHVEADKNTRYENVKQGNNTTDKVFLLSTKEIDEVSEDIRVCEPSQAIKDKIQLGNNGKCRWWLRTLGYDTDCATGVYADGKIDRAGFSVNSDDAVRPAICIRLDLLSRISVS